MRVFLLVAALLAGFATVRAGAAPVGADRDCRQHALQQLRAASPDGFAIYRQSGQPGVFSSWIDCGDAQFDLPTAVHESTHVITSETDAFPLTGGGAIGRPHQVSDFVPPSRIAGRFETDDFTSIYLARGKASSAGDFLYLLDEFNAYTHDLNAAVDLKDLTSTDRSVDHRDGLAAMMAFLDVYLEMARASEPATWSGLRQPEVASTISALWTRAERVMARSCGIPNFGTSDRSYLQQVCAAGSRSALAQVLGRAPMCPRDCLEPSPMPASDDTEVASSPSPYGVETVDPQIDGDVASAKPRHPFAGNIGPRRHRLRADAE